MSDSEETHEEAVAFETQERLTEIMPTLNRAELAGALAWLVEARMASTGEPGEAVELGLIMMMLSEGSPGLRMQVQALAQHRARFGEDAVN